MNLGEATSKFRKLMWRRIGDCAAQANRQLRHVNMYRAAEYQLAAQHGLGAKALFHNEYAIERLGNFDENNQDKDRPAWARKLQLSHRAKHLCLGLANMVDHFVAHPTSNPVVLRQLKQISDAFVGPRGSADEARAYMRRAARKLHPDKCRDLEGWRIPNIAYSRFIPADYKYEQAKWGAEGLYALHRSLDHLYANDYYARELNGPVAKKGSTLKPKHVLAEYSLVAAMYCLIVPKAVAVASAIGVLLAAWWFFTLAKQNFGSRGEVTCRQIVSFATRPTSSDDAL